MIGVYGIDIEFNDMLRNCLIIEGMGDLFDPAGMLRGEQEATRMLYSDLDEDQQATYDMLVREGVL